MPHIKFRGIQKEKIISNSKEIIDNLTNLIGCDRNWFTLEHIETEYIFDGKIVQGYTFVDVFWFEREKETQDKVAEFITIFLKKINDNNDITVIFNPLIGKNYYDNGVHF
ncbi:MAG: DUF1904 domain-containing protein [Fusobacteriaceae bacterium]